MTVDDEDARKASDICEPGQVGWQQHKMSVRLGSEPGSNMHIMPCLWLAEVRGVVVRGSARPLCQLCAGPIWQIVYILG